jgi:hypothetical protein
LDRKTAAYLAWIETANLKRISGKKNKLTEGFLEVLDPYHIAREKLMDELKKFAHEHLQ